MSTQPNPNQIAYCGLYCEMCKVYQKGKCVGCKSDEKKAEWCKLRTCCIEHGHQSCADCQLMPIEDCKKFNNFFSKLFGLLYGSDRKACIAKIKDSGYEEYAKLMHCNGCSNNPNRKK